MEKMAKWLTYYIAQKTCLDKEEKEVYCYGFQVGLEVILNTVISIFLSIYIGMLWQCILFFMFFIPLRSYAGGIHARRYLNCLLASCLSLTVILVMVKYITIPWKLSVIISCVCWGMLWFLSPVEGENRTLNIEEKVCYRKKVRWYISILIVLEVSFILYQGNKIVMLITLASVEACFSQILELLRKNNLHKKI